MDNSESGRFVDHNWVKTLNGQIGLFAIAVAMIVIVIIILTFIIRIFQFPHLRKHVGDYFIDLFADNTRSIPTRILKMIVFLLLTAGLVGLTSYNVYKMINDPPSLSVTLEENNISPSMLFCPGLENIAFELNSAEYFTNFN